MGHALIANLGPPVLISASCSWLPHIVQGAVASLAMLGLRSGHCQCCSLPSLSLSGCLGRYVRRVVAEVRVTLAIGLARVVDRLVACCIASLGSPVGAFLR